MITVICLINLPGTRRDLRELLTRELKLQEALVPKGEGDFVITSDPARVDSFLAPPYPQLLIVDNRLEQANNVLLFKESNPSLAVLDLPIGVKLASEQLTSSIRTAFEISSLITGLRSMCPA